MIMAPTKLENQIQEKLISREIKPSAQAWDRLDAMLTVVEEKKTKKKLFFWVRNIGIAASLFLVLFLGIYLIEEIPNSKFQIPNEKQLPEVVKTNPEVSGEKPTEEIQIPTTKRQISNPLQVAQTSYKSKTKNSKPVEVSIVNQNQNKPIVEVFTKTQEVPEPFISQEVVVSNSRNSNTEIETSAKKEIIISKIKVNATSLLSQVDKELNQKYRETKLEKIARNLNSVKDALANRNNE